MRLKLYLITLFVYTALGWLWFILVGQKFSDWQFGKLLPGYLNYILLGVLYLLAVAGIYFFAVGPFLCHDNVTSAAFKAGFAGLIFSSGGVCSDYFTSRTEPLWLYLTQIIWLPVMLATTVAVTVWVGKKWM
jgi:uncharacterized membrane protein